MFQDLSRPRSDIAFYCSRFWLPRVASRRTLEKCCRPFVVAPVRIARLQVFDPVIPECLGQPTTLPCARPIDSLLRMIDQIQDDTFH
jgi:hypothetical protein